jgi:hypothetical protein
MCERVSGGTNGRTIMKVRTNGLRLAVATAACVASLGFAACGGDDDESSDDSSAETTTKESDVAETTTTESDVTEAAEANEGISTEELMQKQLKAAGLDDDQISCVIDAINGEYSADEVDGFREEFEDSGATNEEFAAFAAEATATCTQ